MNHDIQHSWDQVTEQDYEVIISQLGREPQGVLKVAYRCAYGYPQVIVNRPINNQGEIITIFPTLLWLTCPYLKKKVSKLESKGLIGEIKSKVKADKEFAAALKENHLSYANLRQRLVPEGVKQVLAKKYANEYKVLMETGVGGTRHYDGVKCLHAHFADYLILKQNVIGEIVYNRLGVKLCCNSGSCGRELATDVHDSGGE